MMNVKLTAERNLVFAAITHPAGFEISLFGGMLSIRPLEDGTYEVSAEDAKTNECIFTMSFNDAEVAATSFVTKREDMKLGYDHEGGD